MNTVTIGSNTFQVRKLPAYPDQLLLARAMSPVMIGLLPIIIKCVTDKELLSKIKEGEVPAETLTEMLKGAFTSLQELKDEELLNITRRSLAAVQVKQGEAGWANVMEPGGQLMFPLDLPTILQLIWSVAEANVLGFFFAARGTSPDGPAKSA